MSETEKPFLSFYQKHNISPVRQDLSDIKSHFYRRMSLYLHLGIPPLLVEGKDVIEFGPGSGHNSIFTASLSPKKYVLVEANPAGLEQTKESLKYYIQKNNIQIIPKNVLDFSSKDKFDLVLAEGLVQLQLDPPSFACHLSSFCKVGGIFVLTTCDYISFFSETLRRLLAFLVCPSNESLENRVSTLLPIFKPHADTLSGMTRRVDDWLIDTLLIPFHGSMFSIPQAITALNKEFALYGSSPNIFNDWRWYKQIKNSRDADTCDLIDQYYSKVHNFIDYRFITSDRDAESNYKLESLCRKVYELEQDFEKVRDMYCLTNIVSVIGEIRNNIYDILPQTAYALDDFVNCIDTYRENKTISKMDLFSSFFGRGMQYLSFIRT